MSILIKGVNVKEIKRGAVAIVNIDDVGYFVHGDDIIPVPDHGDLIDRDELSAAMYHEAFETDSKMQKWDSGCWIRYKMFENKRDNAPVIIPAERSEE